MAADLNILLMSGLKFNILQTFLLRLHAASFAINSSYGVQSKAFDKSVNTAATTKLLSIYSSISTSNHMFKREIWDEFTEFTFLKFWNQKSRF